MIAQVTCIVNSVVIEAEKRELSEEVCRPTKLN